MARLAEGLDTTIQYLYTGLPIGLSIATENPNTLLELKRLFDKINPKEFRYLGEVELIPIKGHIPAGRQ